MAQALDLVVDRRVLLDERVARRDVGLGLVVVVVGDEVLDLVVREELTELVRQLSGQALVRCQHQGGSLHLLDGPRHGRRLARAGDATQRLEALAEMDPLGEGGDRRRLIPRRGEVGHDLERPDHLGFDPCRHGSISHVWMVPTAWDTQRSIASSGVRRAFVEPAAPATDPPDQPGSARISPDQRLRRAQGPAPGSGSSPTPGRLLVGGPPDRRCCRPRSRRRRVAPPGWPAWRSGPGRPPR